MTHICLRSLLTAALLTLARPAFSQDTLIPQAGWSLHAVDSQETDGSENAAILAFDGNPATLWATQWVAAAPPPPHDLQIDLGATHTLGGFLYLPRQDGILNGTVGQYQFFVSNDGVNWGSPVAAGSFQASSQEQRVTFPAATARYIRLRALTEVSGYPWTTVAELNVLSTSAPVVVTQTPETTGVGKPGGLIPQGDSGGLISQTGWRLLSVDSQETAAGDNAAVRAFDGNPYSLWATEWGAATPPPPHDLQIDLGAVYPVSGFRYLPRQDGILNGGIGQYQFYVSPDGLNWGPALAAGTFPATSSEQQVVFTATSGRYIRLRALSEVTGQPWTTVAELNVLSASPGAAVPVSDNQVPIAGSVSRSTRVMFTPSADHDTLVTWYGLEIFSASAEPGSSAPVATMNLGKPGVVNGECSVEVGAIVSALTPGSYVVVVSAVGDVGMSRSEGSAFVIP